MATKTLYVGNIPYSATEADIIAHFTEFKASNARIIEGRGFAFVDIDGDLLDQAIVDKNNSELGGRRLTVNEARPKTPGGGRSFESGGGGGYGGGGDRDYGGKDRDFGGGDRGGRGGRERGGRGKF